MTSFKGLKTYILYKSYIQCAIVLYKSNFEKYYTDVSPAWDCLGVKKEVEL